MSAPPAAALQARGGWYEPLSWEHVDKYPADLLLMDDRPSAIQPSAITKDTGRKLPAVKAGQGIARSPGPILSYDKCAPLLENLAAAIERARKVA